ncbi:MAG: flagellar hook-basal body complex protein FliE [Clostridia bacterium]|nr:flagellar hook-basal body complex protein FliE [Clostridia bacterium]
MEGIKLDLNPVLSTKSIQSDLINSVDTKQNFGEILSKAIDDVNGAQVASENMGRLLAIGEIDNLHDVQIAGQKAELALNLMVQVRNKILDAYSEINRIQF